MTDPASHHAVTDLDHAAKAIWRVSALSLSNFMDVVVFPTSPEPRRFADVRDPWQQERVLLPIIPAVEYAAGVRPGIPGVENPYGPQWFMEILPRGHAKTSVQAALITWGLLFARDNFMATCAASDRQQAQELRIAMADFLRVNEWWLRGKVTTTRDGALGPKGELEIISADAASAYGKKRHMYVCDEFTVWGENKALFDSLFSGADKVKNACFVVTSNAGYVGSWQEGKVDTAKGDPGHWYVYDEPGHRASWMSPETREAKRKMMTPGEARRVLDNTWVKRSEVGDFVTEPEVNRCLALGLEMGLRYQYRALVGARHVASIDYGPKKDRTVCCVLHRDEARDVVVIDQMRIWAGFQYAHDGRRVPVLEVEEWLEAAHRDFHLLAVAVDEFQMEGTIQKYQTRIPIERYQPRGGKGNYDLAVALRNLVTNAKLAWYPGAGDLVLPDGQTETFKNELLSVVLRPMEYGFRIDNIRAGTHDDRCVSVGQGIMLLTDRIPRVGALEMTTVSRHKHDRNLYGVGRQDVPESQRFYEQVHRTSQKPPSAADRRGLYGRGGGKRKWGNR